MPGVPAGDRTARGARGGLGGRRAPGSGGGARGPSTLAPVLLGCPHPASLAVDNVDSLTPTRNRLDDTTAIRSLTVLPARREEIELHTADGLTLVGKLALPAHRPPAAALVTLHSEPRR